jgi:hypothetical protein
MKYQTFSVLAAFGEFSRWFEVSAVCIQSACQDIEQAYGEFRLVCYGSN